MSRSGYADDADNWQIIKWRGAVASAIRGRRGQAFLREMATALDVMEDKRLCVGFLERDGDVCALGAVAVARGVRPPEVHPDDWDEERNRIAGLFGVAPALAAEIMYMNDVAWPSRKETNAERWLRLRQWVAKQIR